MPQPRGQLKDTPKLELVNGTRLRDAGRAEEGKYHLRTRNAMANGMRPAKLLCQRRVDLTGRVELDALFRHYQVR